MSNIIHLDHNTADLLQRRLREGSVQSRLATLASIVKLNQIRMQSAAQSSHPNTQGGLR